MPPKKKAPAATAFQKATEDLQALGQQGLLYWVYFLVAQRMKIEAAMRAKGELAAPATPASGEGLSEIDGL